MVSRPPARRLNTNEKWEALLPLAKWGAIVCVAVLGGLGLTRISAGYRTASLPQSFPIEVKTLLGNKPMPGAAVTFTPVMPTPQAAVAEGESSSTFQRVGRGTVRPDGTVSPSLSSNHPGLPAGEYVVSLTWSKVEIKDGESVAGPDRVPQIFRTPSTSTLRLTVKAGGNSPTTLALVNPQSRVKRASYDPE